MVPQTDANIYEYLGISFESSTQEIKRAYKNKAKELHPDKNKDDPRAKEKFQKLKEYCDILLNPALKIQYDTKIKAKIAAAKRHSELDDERRRLKEVLEAKEKEAAKRRNETQRMAEKEKVADRIRKEWEAAQESAARVARCDHQNMTEAVVSNSGFRFVVSVKWSKNNTSHMYDKDALFTYLHEFGQVLNLIVGKKCTAVAEFDSSEAACKAIKASSVRFLGHPDNPLKISWAGGINQGGDMVPDPHLHFVGKRSRASPSKSSPMSGNPLSDSMSFEGFESDILAKMARFG